MSSETVTVYIAGVLPGHKSFDAPIVASAEAHMYGKMYVVPRGGEFGNLVGQRTHIPHAELSTTRLSAAKRYVERCNVKLDAAAVALTKAQQTRDAAIALLDFERANPQ